MIDQDNSYKLWEIEKLNIKIIKHAHMKKIISFVHTNTENTQSKTSEVYPNH